MKLDELLRMELFERREVRATGEGSQPTTYILRVPDGWNIDGVFVPEPETKMNLGKAVEKANSNITLAKDKALQSHYDSTVGLLATDQPQKILDALPEELRELMFEIKG
jgi:predicted RNase H-like HicB family nuclease